MLHLQPPKKKKKKTSVLLLSILAVSLHVYPGMRPSMTLTMDHIFFLNLHAVLVQISFAKGWVPGIPESLN